MCSLLLAANVVQATETDQFTTPPSPLMDIGPMLSRKVVEIIESDRTGKNPERILADWVGRSIFESRLTIWVKQLRTEDGRVDFRPSMFESVFRTALSPAPASFCRAPRRR